MSIHRFPAKKPRSVILLQNQLLCRFQGLKLTCDMPVFGVCGKVRVQTSKSSNKFKREKGEKLACS